MLPRPSPDILVYVALSEEFDFVVAELPVPFEPFQLRSVPLTAYRGEITAETTTYRVVIVPAFRMGPTAAAAIASVIVGEFEPHSMVVLGISGSMSDDLQLGDVFLPASVKEFLANAAAAPQGENDWTLSLSGHDIASHGHILNGFQNLKYTNKPAFDAWQSYTQTLSDQCVPDPVRQKLNEHQIPFEPRSKLKVGDDRKLASGSIVGKDVQFVKWLKEQSDRKYAAMEMEAAGVYYACQVRTSPPQVIAIRGISDYADQRKEKIQNLAGARFRELATRNATAALVCGIRAGLFGKKRPEQPEAPAENVYGPLVKWIDQAFRLNNWSYYCDMMIRGMVPYFFEEAVDGLNAFVFRAIWPDSSLNLRDAILNLNDHATRFLEFYMKHARPAQLELYRGDFFYDRLPDESDVKHKGAELFGVWAGTCISLLWNVVFALNEFADQVRRSLDPQFHATQKFVVEDAQGVWAPSNHRATSYIPDKYEDSKALLENYEKENAAFAEYQKSQK